MKQTLLDLVQDILSELDSDNVNSIYDTVESNQVAVIIKKTFESLAANRNWAENASLTNLQPIGDVTRPTHLRLQDNVKELMCVNYNKEKSDSNRLRYEEVKPITPDAFLRRSNSLNSESDNVEVVEDQSGVKFMVNNNKAPQYYTSFDDTHLVFDSYDKAVNTTLQSTRIQAMAYLEPKFIMKDDYIPELPSEAFPKLYAESLSRASLRLNQEGDQKAEQDSQIQDNWLARKNRRMRRGIVNDSYNYGRRSVK